MKLRFLLPAALALSVALNVNGQEITKEAKERASGLVNQMTLDEKLDYIGGINDFYIRAVPRLGIPEIRMADGPQGVRNDTKSTLYPSGVVTASTWDRELVHKMGEQLGKDCKARGVGFILGPGVNMYRSPLCGRNFEYFGEDPYLASETAVQYIRGVQSQGVISTIKHFCANDEEWDRYDVSSEVDERTLQELYLATFRKAVTKAHVGAIMSSYNMVNGEHTPENPHLIQDIMRGQWGFEGIYMTDWGAAYSGIASANAGLDLEMPSGKYMNPAVLKEAIKNGVVDERVIDEKVQHILQTLIAFGMFDKPREDKSIPQNNPESAATALTVAEEGIVLLKNDGNMLPLKKGNYVVIGPNADVTVMGGGSGEVHPFSTVTIAAGMDAVGKQFKSTLISTSHGNTQFGETGEFFTDASCKTAGLVGQYYDNMELEGQPAATRTDTGIEFEYAGKESPMANFPGDKFSIRWSGVYCPLKDQKVSFVLTGDDGFRMGIDGKKVIDDWGNHSAETKKYAFDAKKGQKYNVEVEYYENTDEAVMKLEYSIVGEGLKKWEDQIRKADGVIFCGGLNQSIEGEGHDRPFEIPSEQTEMMNQIYDLNKNLAVVMNCGGAVDFSGWSDKAKAILYAMYPGQEGGTAVAEILTGKVNPSGKLIYSIGRRAEDNPCFNTYQETKDISGFRDTDLKKIQYSEGLFTGYRGYEKNNVAPLYPFGYGMSYTTFEYSNFKVKKAGKKGNEVELTFEVKNTGKAEGAEVAQIYVGEVKPSVVRPAKELKGYEKVFLKAGQKKKVMITLDDEAFQHYDVVSKSFVVNPGEYRIWVGSSSAKMEFDPQSVTL